LVLIPSVVALLVSDAPTAQSFSDLALSVVLWIFWLALWRTPRQACLVATPLLIVMPVTVYLLLSYHSPLNPAVIGIILETNVEESSQFLRGLWLPSALSYAALTAAAWLALRVLARHEVRWQRRDRVLALLLAPMIFGALHLVYQPLETAAAGLLPSPNRYRVTPWPEEIESARLTSPFGVLLQIADAVDAEHRIMAASRARATYRFGAHQTLDNAQRQVYVLVIGESARKDRWSINGYEHPTSPRLRRETNLVSFGDVVTVVPSTRIAVPIILTRASPDHTGQLGERSLVSAFREAGFATYWLSTQAPVGSFDATFSTFARESEHLTYYNVTGGWNDTPPDGIMIEPLKRILANSAEGRQLIVLHTLGSHLQYRRRYPDEFDVFKPSLTRTDPQLWHDQAYKASLSNTYDNSILYTDYFLSEVLAALKASGRPLAAMVYVSDHGEDLNDGGCDNRGHGLATIAGLRIPLFFWYSDAYQQTFAAKVAQLQRHRNEPLTNESVFPLLLDAAEIHFPGEDLSRSVMSDSFVRPAKRIVYSLGPGAIDFDRAHLNEECALVN
jgi:glucan phosphoethanolaminetransferase (alkaline phosphatase superfamily)